MVATTPPPAQIRADVRRAERSRALWATVNICDTRAHRGVIGIRGQVPALGFPTQLEMTIRLQYYDTGRGAFVAIPHLSKRLSLGTAANGTIQGGAAFSFSPPVTLSGAITFSWRHRGRLIASTTRRTSAGAHGVDDGDPKGYSAATCTIS